MNRTKEGISVPNVNSDDTRGGGGVVLVWTQAQTWLRDRERGLVPKQVADILPHIVFSLSFPSFFCPFDQDSPSFSLVAWAAIGSSFRPKSSDVSHTRLYDSDKLSSRKHE